MENHVNLSSWMGLIQGRTLLRNISIPGTVHSAAGQNAGLFRKLMAAQRLSVKEQLLLGIRLFHFSLKYWDGQMYIDNGTCKGIKYSTVTPILKRFLIENPTETILINITGNIELEYTPTTQARLSQLYSEATDIRISASSIIGSRCDITLDQCRGKFVYIEVFNKHLFPGNSLFYYPDMVVDKSWLSKSLANSNKDAKHVILGDRDTANPSTGRGGRVMSIAVDGVASSIPSRGKAWYSLTRIDLYRNTVMNIIEQNIKRDE